MHPQHILVQHTTRLFPVCQQAPTLAAACQNTPADIRGPAGMEPSPLDTSEDLSAGQKKNRKKYTLTKQRELWTPAEHDRFLEALQRYNRDWRKIEQHVGSKTVVQIRSHAQKYFQKVMKSGGTDPIPPPRAKRRHSDPPTTTGEQRARGSDRSSSGRQHAGAGIDSGGEEHGSHRAISSPATAEGPEAAAAAAAQMETYRQHCSHGMQYVYMFLSAVLEEQPLDQVATMLQNMPPRDRQLVVHLMGAMREELQQTTGATQQQQQQQGLDSSPAVAAAAAAAAAAAGIPAGGLQLLLQQQQQQQQQQGLQQMLSEQQQAAANAQGQQQQQGMLPAGFVPDASFMQLLAQAGNLQQQQQQQPQLLQAQAASLGLPPEILQLISGGRHTASQRGGSAEPPTSTAAAGAAAAAGGSGRSSGGPGDDGGATGDDMLMDAC